MTTLLRRAFLCCAALTAAGFALAGFVAYGSSGPQSESADGKPLFERRCGGCHALDRDKEGPRLGGVYGRTAGTVDSFTYSDALKQSKIVWAGDTLDRWLADPEKLVPNNDMTFHVESAQEREQIIAYLKSASGR